MPIGIWTVAKGKSSATFIMILLGEIRKSILSAFGINNLFINFALNNKNLLPMKSSKLIFVRRPIKL
jgi:hypothetical protein